MPCRKEAVKGEKKRKKEHYTVMDLVPALTWKPGKASVGSRLSREEHEQDKTKSIKRVREDHKSERKLIRKDQNRKIEL